MTLRELTELQKQLRNANNMSAIRHRWKRLAATNQITSMD